MLSSLMSPSPLRHGCVVRQESGRGEVGKEGGRGVGEGKEGGEVGRGRREESGRGEEGKEGGRREKRKIEEEKQGGR